MTRPTKHPRTGTYFIRIAVPADLRDTTQRLFGVRAEFRENLGTKDAAQAKQRAADAIARIQAKLDRARREIAEAPQRPTAREIAAIAGEWYRRRTGANASSPEAEELHIEVALHLRSDDPTPRAEAFEPYAEGWAETLLKRHGFATDDETIARLAAVLIRAEQTVDDFLTRRAEGDWSPDPALAKYPKLPAPTAKPQTNRPEPAKVGFTFDALLAGWALDRGWKVDAKPTPRPLYDRMRTLERLAKFLGHRDADRVTQADAVRWKEDAQTRGSATATVRNDISEMSALWIWGIRNGKLANRDNPFAGILPPKAKRRSRDPRAFTNEEAAAILQKARSETGFLRWLPWVLCLTGARLNEICQAVREDITVTDGINVIRIHDEGEGRSVKNADSRRAVPLHPALVSEGFLDYVASLPKGSPLWPDVAPDRVFGQRSTTAGRKVARWLRSELNITDPLISPNHSWRHWFIGACRGIVMPVEVRSAITGHSARMDESAAYGAGMGTFVQVVAAYLAKVPCPVGAAPGKPADDFTNHPAAIHRDALDASIEPRRAS